MLFSALFAVLVPSDPVEIGIEAIQEAAQSRASDVSVTVSGSGPKESYSITSRDGKVKIVGADPNGAMYGCFEFAERLHTQGETAWNTSAKGSPFLADRGLNLFLTLPWDYSKNDTDISVGALTDPKRWWFQSDSYWTTLLDLMAHSRLNWLDIHGAWDISVTNAPNLYAYFVTSPSFPLVGVPEEAKAKDLARLNKVISMAHARGIRVSLMAYEANLKVPQNPDPPYEANEANVYTYTKEAVTEMIKRAPGLDAIGFRIGESGKSESFFKCYGEAIKESGRDIPLITRSWITTKQKVLPLARSSHDFTVEIKYNGEQWAAPYMVAGGRMANWGSYSFEDYLSDSGNQKLNAKTWPGNATADGGTWPSEPYKIVWQVRANGTNRIFPSFAPDLVRSSIKEMKIGTASGYTIEGLDAYYPKSSDYYLADPNDAYCDWLHQRDELYWTTWGRLGYDPDLPNSTFTDYARRWFGERAPAVTGYWSFVSDIVPLIAMSHLLGPDHRNHAPELENCGTTQDFISAEPFDPLVFRSVQEEIAYHTLGLDDGRVKPQNVAWDLLFMSAGVLGDKDSLSPSSAASKREKELATSARMLGSLAAYFANRTKSAYEVAENDRLSGFPAQDSYAVTKFDEAVKSWKELSSSSAGGYYKPFTERLRMGTNTFTWKSQEASLDKYRSELVAMPSAKTLTEWVSDAEWFSSNGFELKAARKGDNYVCRLTGSESSLEQGAFLLYKPLPSSTFFHKMPMTRRKGGFEAKLPIAQQGYCIAAEVRSKVGKKTTTMRVPSISGGIGLEEFHAPYVVIPSLPGATPQLYSTEEAMTYLEPSALDPKKHGTLLIAPRAYQFFNRFDRATKRKLLDPVERGMRLLILQQDFMGGRYKLDWLPAPLNLEACPTPDTFDAKGAFGIGAIKTPDIMWQHFVASPGWDIVGNGSFAHMKLGKGDIWVCAGRLMQRMTNAACARALKALMESNGKSKPAVVVDAGTEGASYTTAFYPDLMNALGVPFLTLGEVIANEQGMKSFDPIPGVSSDDDVLNGKGTQIANSFLRAQVVKMSHRAAPATITAFETERKRRRTELMKSLGLDPMPAKTPLNARITGTIQRAGYTIEKLVFESRPNFYVTGYVYKADNAPKGRLPVIVNVNGHWAHKKSEDRLQLRCAFEALRGYLAIAIDSPGHSFEGDSLIERRQEGDHNDFSLVEGGTNATGYYVWDAIRALDYVATRPDADMSHVGLTGASGGGLTTLYTFAADDRYQAAVPVVYMASLELAPDNGCLCNHVPGTCQVGDRSDVLAIQAPKPVFIIGAQNDGEFPPAATKLTAEKVRKEWKLFGKETDTYVQIFEGPHDYNKSMREAMIGFFDKYIRSHGDGSPVSEPEIQVFDPEDKQFLVLDKPIDGERTMRELAQEALRDAPGSVPVSQVFAVNNGLPAKSPLNLHELGTGRRRGLTFESQPGLVTPAILDLPQGSPGSVKIVVNDAGKQSEIPKVRTNGDRTAWLYLDVLGTGELSNFELRYPVYMGTSVSFMGGWQIVRAAEFMKKYSSDITVVGTGPVSSQAAMFAGLMDTTITSVVGKDCLKDWASVFNASVPSAAIQPRANLCGSLAALRSKVRNSKWMVKAGL